MLPMPSSASNASLSGLRHDSVAVFRKNFWVKQYALFEIHAQFP